MYKTLSKFQIGIGYISKYQGAKGTADYMHVWEIPKETNTLYPGIK